MYAGEKNPMVAGAKVLRVFRFVPDLDIRSGREEEQGRLKMECLSSWEMFGLIQPMATVKLLGGERDALFLIFKVLSVASLSSSVLAEILSTCRREPQSLCRR